MKWWLFFFWQKRDFFRDVKGGLRCFYGIENVLLLHCGQPKSQLYVGMTSEIEIRVRQHKEGRFEGFSKKYNCNRLIWFERFPYVNDAIAREKQLKGVVAG